MPQMYVTVCRTDLMDTHSRGPSRTYGRDVTSDNRVDPAFRESAVRLIFLDALFYIIIIMTIVVNTLFMVSICVPRSENPLIDG